MRYFGIYLGDKISFMTKILLSESFLAFSNVCIIFFRFLFSFFLFMTLFITSCIVLTCYTGSEASGLITVRCFLIFSTNSFHVFSSFHPLPLLLICLFLYFFRWKKSITSIKMTWMEEMSCF